MQAIAMLAEYCSIEPAIAYVSLPLKICNKKEKSERWIKMLSKPNGQSRWLSFACRCHNVRSSSHIQQLIEMLFDSVRVWCVCECEIWSHDIVWHRCQIMHTFMSYIQKVASYERRSCGKYSNDHTHGEREKTHYRITTISIQRCEYFSTQQLNMFQSKTIKPTIWERRSNTFW